MSVCPYCASDNIVEIFGDHYGCNDCKAGWKPLDALERQGR